MYSHLFSKVMVGGKELKNRITMAPLYLGYAGEGGTVSELFLDHYELMAKSGVGMVVVENASRFLGKEVEVAVTSILQTTAGRLIFTIIKDLEHARHQH